MQDLFFAFENYESLRAHNHILTIWLINILYEGNKVQRIIEGINVNTFGKSTNEAIVFIHGFPFDHTLWNDVIDEFKDEYYCVSYDIRGFGKSEISTVQFTRESYTQDLESVVLGLKLDKPIICGFSMGGYMALRANERENYNALILANTTTSSDDDKAKLKRVTGISNIDTKGLKPFLDAFLSVAFSEDFIKKKPLKMKQIKENIMNFNPIGIKAALLSLSNSGHTGMIENPDGFKNAVRNFLQTL
jgi:3-oxoadipate enol-lactonase